MKISLIEKENAGAASEIYDKLTQKQGRVLNFFKVLAHKPDVLKGFIPFYSAVTAKGELPDKLKELAYLRTSILNGCEY